MKRNGSVTTRLGFWEALPHSNSTANRWSMRKWGSTCTSGQSAGCAKQPGHAQGKNGEGVAQGGDIQIGAFASGFVVKTTSRTCIQMGEMP